MKRVERLLAKVEIRRIAEDVKGDPFVEIWIDATNTVRRLYEGETFELILDLDRAELSKP